MSDDDKAEGCGFFVGNGDKPGPLWIVDATDFSKLGPANDKKSPEQAFATDTALRKASEDALVATWTNPAGRAGGSLTFSPHNQQIVGDRIYLSHYHGGVYVLDASAAFAGKRERPKELGFIVPHDKQTRPLLGQPPLTGLLGRFFTDFPLGRPEVWDMVAYKGHVLAADMTGGFYSLRYDDSPLPQCADTRVPTVGLQPQELEPARQAHLPARQRLRQGLQRRRGDVQAPGRGAARDADGRAQSCGQVQVRLQEGDAGPRAQLPVAGASSRRRARAAGASSCAGRSRRAPTRSPFAPATAPATASPRRRSACACAEAAEPRVSACGAGNLGQCPDARIRHP